jgi:hypothetical protein
MSARVLALLAAAACLTACTDTPEPTTWSLFIEFDGQDYFVAERITERECMRMVYQADRMTHGAANYRCEEVNK